PLRAFFLSLSAISCKVSSTMFPCDGEDWAGRAKAVLSLRILGVTEPLFFLTSKFTLTPSRFNPTLFTRTLNFLRKWTFLFGIIKSLGPGYLSRLVLRIIKQKFGQST